MGLDDIPLFAMLKSKMSYVNARQQVIAQNVANADTPNYVPQDLKPFSFAAMAQSAASPGAGLGLISDQPGQIGASRSVKAGVLKPVDTPDTEARIDGNQVVLEDQMNKLTQARIDYVTAVDLYQQSMSMITTAARAPGKSA